MQCHVTCFKTNPLDCTLLAYWQPDYKEPWLIVTDFKPEQADILWYSLRTDIESSYRDIKSDGWQWHKTRLRNPKRAERLWLAIAVATLWTVTVGSEPVDGESSRTGGFPSVKRSFSRRVANWRTLKGVGFQGDILVNPEGDINHDIAKNSQEQPSTNYLAQKATTLKKTSRHISCFLQGLLTIIADLLNGKAISLNGLFPEPRVLLNSATIDSS